MANSTARMLLKSGKTLPQLFRCPLVGQLHANICNKEQQLFQSLINPTQKIFEQKPIMSDGFSFVDFVLDKDHVLRTEQWKLWAIEAARGKRVVDDDEDDEKVEDFDDDDEEDGDDYDDDDDDDGDIEFDDDCNFNDDDDD